MTTRCPPLLCISVATLVAMVTSSGHHDKHGGVPMGDPSFKNYGCDDGQHGIEVDWDGKSDPFTCYSESKIAPGTMLPIEVNEKEPKQPFHRCLSYELEYNGLPLSGEHRPLWPKFGEYTYLPPQRWIHSLEHAAIVFLYHPCAPDSEVEKFRKVVKGCLWKHIISPSKRLNVDRPYALLSWGHAIRMDHFDEVAARNWIKKHGMQDGSEAGEYHDGQYDFALIHKARKIGDGKDSDVCGEYERENNLDNDETVLPSEILDLFQRR